MSGLRFATLADYQELSGAWITDVTKAAIERCIAAQRVAGSEHVRRFVPDRSGGHVVSAEALAELVRTGGEWPDPALERNMIAFNLPVSAPILHDAETARQREVVDRALSVDVARLFAFDDEIPGLVAAGQLWYPAGGYRAWHTNNKHPGWRLYVTYCDEPGRSFFRYRDPLSAEVVTSPDKRWTLRIFNVGPDRPFWHAVYSQTDRFSFGYRLQRHG
jgi:hypothetical protein